MGQSKKATLHALHAIDMVELILLHLKHHPPQKIHHADKVAALTNPFGSQGETFYNAIEGALPIKTTMHISTRVESNLLCRGVCTLQTAAGAADEVIDYLAGFFLQSWHANVLGA